jgi:flavin-dependent dehydrogenase
MTWDALVIGAGPAGSVTARELARRGRRVLLVDRATFPRSKVCGCCLNGAAIRTLDRLGLGRVLEGAMPLDRLTLAAGSRTATMALPRGVALSREVLDARLLEAAVECGVEFRPGTMVNRDSDLPTRASVTIVASGLTGGEATAEKGSRIGAGIVLPAEDARGFFHSRAIHMATGRGGYVGLVRVEDDRLDVAAAFDSAFVKTSGGPGAAAESILRRVGWPVPPGLAEGTWRGTPALTRRPVRLANRGVFVVGDAAGYVEPFTGEGMAWAVMSAAALAPIAARAIERWDDSLARDWETAHRRLIGRRQRTCRTISRVLRSPFLTGLGVRILGLVPALAHPVISALNRPAPQGQPA